MKCKRLSGFVVSIGVFVLSVLVLEAQTAHSRRHEAHEHGVAHLNVAVEDDDLYLEFVSPAANIVGFEHSPRTVDQKNAVKKAVETLKDGAALIVLPVSARCRLAEPVVDTDIDGDPSSEHHEHHEAEEHQRHAEFTAEYHFVCDHPDKLAHLDVMLFRDFPGIERIEVQLITGTKQTALELTAKKNRVPF